MLFLIFDRYIWVAFLLYASKREVLSYPFYMISHLQLYLSGKENALWCSPWLDELY